MANKKKVIATIYGTTTDVCRETKKSDVNFIVQIGDYKYPMHATALFKAVKEVESADNQASSRKDAGEPKPPVQAGGGGGN